ncbi:MAG: alpha/beta hydrolase [Myxococcota bacterium]
MRFGALVLSAVVASGCATVVRGQANRQRRRVEHCGLQRTQHSIDAGRLDVWSGGAGPPVVLLHGFGGDVTWQFTEVMCELAEAHRVVAPNLLGFGESHARRPADVTLNVQSNAVAELLRTLDVPTAAVVGTSYGGLVAYQLAVAQPELVSRLILVDTPGPLYSREELDALQDRFGVASTESLFVPSDAAGVERLLRLAYADPPWTNRGIRRAVAAELYEPRRDDLKHLLRSLERELPDPSAAPRGVAMPAMVVWGAEDPVFDRDKGLALAELLGAEWVVIDQAKHAPNLEHPAEFNAHVRRFVSAP